MERSLTPSNTLAASELNLQEPMVLLMPTKHLGNLLVSLHCIQAIIRASQGHSLLVVDESYRDIIESITDTGKVLYYPRQQLRTASLTSKARLLYHFYQQLRRHQATLLLDFDGQSQSSTISQLSGIRERIGPADAHRSKGVYTRQLADIEHFSHRFNDYAQYLSSFLGETPKPQYPRLNERPQHRHELQALLDKHAIDHSKPYICIHVGATKAYKRWPAEHYAAIADWLAEQGLQIILLGAEAEDAQRVSEVSAKCAHKPFNLCDQLNIRQLLSLLQQATFFLGNDSGPMHLAAAAGTSVYAIFGPTDEVRWGPLGSKAKVIRNPIACESSCSKKLCPANHRCINTLSVEQVKSVLQQHPL
ncbi:MAG: glycosyltransferase family 9 protein [Gammaproteobacteria bacterium]|nr:glycosyltransferase family 9 protein [Gammaproteobacteria bacterium]MBQ0841194.1 glycosyltransferase family 9 protein [Gammaproteobacteria bacterium]